MRIFTESERALVRQLATWRDGRPFPMEEFLVAHVFVHEYEQAVIIHPQRRCAVLYHAVNVSLEEQRVDGRRFFEMVALLSYLRTSGLLVVLDSQLGAGALYYLHASFDRPRVEGQVIKLNERGDYTRHPETILDKDNHVLFKGTLLEGETYELLTRSLAGTVCISQALLALVASWETPASDTLRPASSDFSPEPTPVGVAALVPVPRNSRRELLLAVTVLAVSATLSYLCLRARSAGVALAAVSSSIDRLAREQGELRQSVAPRPATPEAPSAEPLARTPAPQSSAMLEGSTKSPAPTTARPHETAREPPLRRDTRPATNAQAPQAPVSSSSAFYGVDISHWNGDFAREIDQIPGLAFAISKATQGTRLRDSQFARNRELLRKRKIAHGSYHFFIQAEDAVAQAEFFLATIGAVAADDIAPVLDVEDSSLPHGTETDAMHVQVNVLLLLRTLATKSGRRPILYTNYAFAQRYFKNPAFADYRLWLAEYTSAPPRVPDTWREAGFFIWQKTGSHKVGCREIDLDVFFGQKPQLFQ